MHQLIAMAELQKEPKRSRGLAILCLLYGRTLHRSEVASLRMRIGCPAWSHTDRIEFSELP